MENILEKIANERAKNMSKAIDDYALKVFNAPAFISKRLWLYKIYGRLLKFQIKLVSDDKPSINNRILYRAEFWKRDRKVGELVINQDK